MTWSFVDFSDTWIDIELERLFASGHDDAVLVAPKRHRSYARFIEVFRRLQDLGVVEP